MKLDPDTLRRAKELLDKNDVGETTPTLLYPSQIPKAEALGWVRGRDYAVYSCIVCFHEMDKCACPKDEMEPE